jgi:hypothetical protein
MIGAAVTTADGDDASPKEITKPTATAIVREVQVLECAEGDVVEVRQQPIDVGLRNHRATSRRNAAIWSSVTTPNRRF